MAKNKKTTTDKPVSSLQDFKSAKRGIFELPSGRVVKMRNPGGLMAFVINGSIPNALLALVQDGLSGGKANQSSALAKAKEMAKDMESLSDIMKLQDIIAAQTIIEPPCRLVPTEDDYRRFMILNPSSDAKSAEDLRDDEKYLYTDEIDDIDKQYVMQWVTGGTRDLETFRAEQAAGLAAVSGSPVAEGGTELTAGPEEEVV